MIITLNPTSASSVRIIASKWFELIQFNITAKTNSLLFMNIKYVVSNCEVLIITYIFYSVLMMNVFCGKPYKQAIRNKMQYIYFIFLKMGLI